LEWRVKTKEGLILYASNFGINKLVSRRIVVFTDKNMIGQQRKKTLLEGYIFVEEQRLAENFKLLTDRKRVISAISEYVAC